MADRSDITKPREGNYAEFLRRIPKVELHVHLAGSVRPSTFFAMAQKNQLELPDVAPEELYGYDNLLDFLKVYNLVSRSIRTREDFSRVTYESMEDGVKQGNLRYREMFFNPTAHALEGVDYRTMMDGILDGVRAAEVDYGARCRLIPAIHRRHSPDIAQEMMERLVEEYRDDIIGLGSDSGDGTGRADQFLETYRFAQRHGLRTTVHAAESRNTAHNFSYAVDVLKCDRIDHGYDIVGHQTMVQRAKDDGLWFTCCPSALAVVLGWKDRANQPIRNMIELGLKVTLNSDDPPMFRTDIGNEFVETCIAMDFDDAEAEALCLGGIDASWLDDSEKRSMRGQFVRDIATLRAELLPGHSQNP